MANQPIEKPMKVEEKVNILPAFRVYPSQKQIIKKGEIFRKELMRQLADDDLTEITIGRQTYQKDSTAAFMALDDALKDQANITSATTNLDKTNKEIIKKIEQMIT